MRITFIILGIITAVLGLALSILPFGTIALIPIILALVFGLIAFRMSAKESKGSAIIKVIFLTATISLGLTIYNILKPNEVNREIESISKENQSKEDSIEELESIEIDE